ncbi:MAG: YggS family pyridoxal phosphate-dependent enzyme [Chitinophagaceae bacterium]|nr:YggS family pyridoxal phosphate-dependent enzyme [Chitinophagaceae bacterium]
MTINERLQHIRSAIDTACRANGRQPDEVRLLLATKTVEPEQIRQAFGKGMNYVGENKVQELKRKQPLLQADNVTFHFIGHLQTNKVKDVLRYAHCIQSVDRLPLAEALDRELQKQGRSMPVLLQVNTSYEESKFGISPEQAALLARQVSALGTLQVQGLMTIGLFSAEEARVRQCFRRLAAIRAQLSELDLPNTRMDELSMGMSGDYEAAIAEGATMVRIGTALFGERVYPDTYYWNENTSL